MRKKTICILFFIFINFSFAQKMIWPVDVEIFVIVQGLTSNNEIGVRMTAESKVWKYQNTPGSWTFYLTGNEYDEVWFPGLCLTIGNTNLPWAYGYNIVGGNSFSQPTIGHGLYALEIYDNDCQFYPIIFYLDYRDCDYPTRSRPDGTISPYYGSPGGNDIWILYNATTSTCSLSTNGSTNWVEISNYEYLSYWAIKNKSTGIPYTNYFPSYWSYSLALISTSNQHPRLVWGPHPTFNATHYRIYRAVSNNPVNPLSLNYSLISSVSSSTFEYTDYAVTILPGYQYAYYYVVGYNGSSESSKTNYVSTPAEFHKQLPVELLNEYTLLQNYPNPFNPSTKISYSIKEEGLVTLKVYDILGKEIATLVNENKPSGNYEAEFNASALPSGMYIYKLQAGNFTDVKKMLLLK